MHSSVCRWGILGTANIARKNWKAILNADNATLIGVASRQRNRAVRFIDECQSKAPFDKVPIAFGSYDELLDSDSIDAVYVPLPTGIRKEWVIRAARAGKHVLVEKPVAATTADVIEMLDVCREQNVQFMDGVMFMHSTRLSLLRDLLHDGASVGKIRRVSAAFSFAGDDEFHASNIRTNAQLEPLGCLGDLGWYTARIILWLADWQLPQRVVGRCLTEYQGVAGDEAVPTEFSAELFFEDGLSASFYCSFITEVQEWLNIGGTLGQIQINDFVLPFFGSELAIDVFNSLFDMDGCDFKMEPHRRQFAVSEYGNGTPHSQEAYMIRRFSANVIAQQIEPVWGDYALKTQQVLDACLQSAKQDGAPIALS